VFSRKREATIFFRPGIKKGPQGKIECFRPRRKREKKPEFRPSWSRKRGASLGKREDFKIDPTKPSGGNRCPPSDQRNPRKKTREEEKRKPNIPGGGGKGITNLVQNSRTRVRGKRTPS